MGRLSLFFQRPFFRGLEDTEKILLDSYYACKFFLEHVPPQFLEKISEKKAFYIHQCARADVPAYRKFLKNKKYNNINSVPETDKKNYIYPFPYEERCFYGHFPASGSIEESSGSTGTPTNWIRAIDEESLLSELAKFEFFYAFQGHKKKYISLSGWSSGPWATGLKFCEIIEKHTLVKNTTADADAIIRSLKSLGTKYNYLITGYPPFLKNLFDRNDLSWSRYKIDILTGGESCPLIWKHYVRKRLKNNKAIIISSYGASDIDIGIGFETPFSEFIRELAQENPELNRALFGSSENPMIFQYNPLSHYIENTGKGDFTVTLLDNAVASPKIKYNLHDAGGKISYNELCSTVEKYARNKLNMYLKKNKTLSLPFLFILGRKDGTISIGGNNIYPEEIDIAIESSPYAKKINRFMIESTHDRNLNVQFVVHVELKKSIQKGAKLQKELEKRILATLLHINLEFREYYYNHQSNQANLQPVVKLYDFDTEKIFRAQDNKIKNAYILS